MSKILKYKAIALDLDGTLLNSRQEISDKTRDILIEYQKAGGIVILATGRPQAGAIRYCEPLRMKEFGGILLSYNSCRIINLQNGDLIQNLTLSPEVVAKAEEVIRSLDDENRMNMSTYQDHLYYCDTGDNEYIDIERRYSQLDLVVIDSFKDTITFPVNKCLVGGEGDYMARKEAQVKAAMGDAVDVYRSDPWFIEIVPKGVDKLAGLKKIADYLKITSDDMAAFGDGFNDISMVQYAGFGVAMGNAQDVVKKAARYITLTNDEDGIYDAIQRFIFVEDYDAD